MKASPCKYCDERGCGEYHSKCPDYQEWKQEHDKEREDAQKRKKQNAEIYEFRRAGVEKSLKRSKKWK